MVQHTMWELPHAYPSVNTEQVAGHVRDVRAGRVVLGGQPCQEDTDGVDHA